ncbi:MAG: coiled coil domain-containing protein [Oligoflexia bacterium]|nr:coiled coil domain-containing protein [Oligoflexia bacterium]MBF0364980.1 coiled coil domain-containing protein [Oligoflexia bacterium]
MNEKRKEYEEKVSAQLEKWNAEIDLLKAKADKAEAGIKIEYLETLSALKRKHEESKVKLSELKSSGDEVWEEVKSGTEKAWDEVKKAFHNAASKFK